MGTSAGSDAKPETGDTSLTAGDSTWKLDGIGGAGRSVCELEEVEGAAGKFPGSSSVSASDDGISSHVCVSLA